MLVHYTEESRECVKEKEIGKQIRGGGQLSVEDGKKMMITGLESSWSEGMLGIEEESSDDELQSMGAGSSGMGSQKRLKLEDGSASVVQPGQPAQPGQAQPAKAVKPLTKKEKEALAKTEKQAAKEKKKADQAMQLQLAKEKEAKEKAQAEAEMKAELGNINCLRRQCLRRRRP